MIVLYEHNGFKLVRAEQGERWYWNEPLPKAGFWYGSNYAHAYLGGFTNETFKRVKKFVPPWRARAAFTEKRFCEICREPLEVFFKSKRRSHPACLYQARFMKIAC